MVYLKKCSSLEERASAQVAINLCQENDFKEIVLCLEKPTYGAFINPFGPSSVDDPDSLIWAETKEDNYKTFYINDKHRKVLWDAAVDEQCQRLTEGLHRFLKDGVHAWINRIALEYLSYSRRQEVLFGMSRYFLMDVLTREDWTEAGRLDEEKLAKRLLEDERLTIAQRYRIACVYCLHGSIPQFWTRLTEEEKRSIGGNDDPSLCQESHVLVLLWSYKIDEHQEEKMTYQKSHLIYAVRQAMCYGNRVALMSCWKRLEKDIRQQMIIDIALRSLLIWQNIRNGFDKWKEQLVSHDLPNTQYPENVKDINLPSYYSELMCFFLSEMDEEQQLTFFKKVFQSTSSDSGLECFLDWPHQDDFLPTINRLWGIIPKEKYGQCLLNLARKYSGDDEKENRYYDYRNMLWALWEKTPKEYKQYVFRHIDADSDGFVVINEGKVLLHSLLEKYPFQDEDETLFKRVFSDLPQEGRREMMRSIVGADICAVITAGRKWSFANWLLMECLPKEEILSFKKQFIQSYYRHDLCFSNLKNNREKFVEALIKWSSTLE